MFKKIIIVFFSVLITTGVFAGGGPFYDNVSGYQIESTSEKSGENKLYKKFVIKKRNIDLGFEFENVTVDPDGNILGEYEIESDLVFTTTNGFNVESQSMKIQDNKLLVTGKLRFPEVFKSPAAIGNSIIEFQIDPDFNVLLQKEGLDNKIYFKGFYILLSQVLINSEGIFLDHSEILLDSGDKIGIEEVFLSFDGELNSAGEGLIWDTNYIIDLNNWHTLIIGGSLSEYGLQLKLIQTVLTNIDYDTSGPTAIIYDCIVYRDEDGSISTWSNTRMNGIEGNQHDIEFKFRGVKFFKQQYEVKDLVITLPQNEIFNNEKISIKNFKIVNGGEFDLQNATITDFKIKGIDIDLYGIETDQDIFKITGHVIIPDDFHNDSIAGMELSINNLIYDYSNKTYDFSVLYNGEIINLLN
ncbi:MAG: hypothetical protein OCD02_24035 [Spirochaetaceae bacterium]